MTSTKELYVDYALYSKVGIYCENPFMRIHFKPSEKIQWQIEGEAFAIKSGVYYFLKERKEEDKELILYTDNSTLLKKFKSKTNAGKWWKEALEMAEKNNLGLQIKFVSGKDNPADVLTRDIPPKSKSYHYQQWLNKQKL